MYDEEQAEPLTEPDNNAATKFHPDGHNHETDSRLDGTATFEQHYARLACHNAGIYNGKWADKTQIRDQDNKAVFDAIAGQLELSDYQKQIGRQEFADLNLRELSTPGGIDTTLVAIMVAAVVSRRDGRSYHPNKNDNDNDRLFTALIDEFDYCDRVVHSAFGKVRSRL